MRVRAGPKARNRRDCYIVRPMAEPIRIVVLDGDETGQELLDQALRVLDSELLGHEIVLEHFDLSLENRRATANGVVHEAAAAMR
jgi:isocitrate dehydrogenase (NAD+)